MVVNGLEAFEFAGEGVAAARDAPGVATLDRGELIARHPHRSFRCDAGTALVVASGEYVAPERRTPTTASRRLVFGATNGGDERGGPAAPAGLAGRSVRAAWRSTPPRAGPTTVARSPRARTAAAGRRQRGVHWTTHTVEPPLARAMPSHAFFACVDARYLSLPKPLPKTIW